MQRLEVLGKNIQKESVADVELDEEIGGSQTGDEKGEEAMHLSPVEAASTQPALRDGNRTGIRANVSYAQRAHQEPWEEEENMRRSRGEERRVAKWDNQRQESVMKVSDWFCSWPLLCLQGTHVKAMETRSCHPEKEMEKEADRVRKEKNGDGCSDAQGRSRFTGNSNSSSLNEMGCREEETGWNEKTKEKEQPGNGPENLRRTQPGRGPEHLVA